MSAPATESVPVDQTAAPAVAVCFASSLIHRLVIVNADIRVVN